MRHLRGVWSSCVRYILSVIFSLVCVVFKLIKVNENDFKAAHMHGIRTPPRRAPARAPAGLRFFADDAGRQK